MSDKIWNVYNIEAHLILWWFPLRQCLTLIWLPDSGLGLAESHQASCCIWNPYPCQKQGFITFPGWQVIQPNFKLATGVLGCVFKITFPSDIEENMLPLFIHWLSSRNKKVSIIIIKIQCFSISGCYKSNFFFHVNWIFRWNFARSFFLPKQCPSLRSIFQKAICLWVKIWYRNQAACSESNPVQSSRYRSTNWPRKGHPLKFE